MGHAGTLRVPEHCNPSGRDHLLHTIVTALTAGAVHVLAGPDHLAAVAPLAANSDVRPWRSGMYWGLGHAGGVLLVGGVAIAARELLPVDRLSAWSEQIVGLVLIGIGVWGIRRASIQSVHSHQHRHDGTRHAHLHVHARPTSRRGSAHPEHAREQEPDHPHGGSHVHARTSVAALGIGVLHGLAGSAHFLGVLPAIALPTREAAATYVVFFGVGTVAAMTGFAALIGHLAARSSQTGTRAYRIMLMTLGLAAILVGITWLIP